MDFSFVLFLLIAACAMIAAIVTTLTHVMRGSRKVTHHNTREDSWYWSRSKQRGASAGR
jgi:hypothetical protein